MLEEKNNTGTPEDPTDLDAFLDEYAGKGMAVKYLNRSWRIKNLAPAFIILQLRRNMANENETMDIEEELKLLRALMDPPEQVDEMLELGLSAEGFSAIIRLALGKYNGIPGDVTLEQMRLERGMPEGTEEDGETEKKAPRARKATR